MGEIDGRDVDGGANSQTDKIAGDSAAVDNIGKVETDVQGVFADAEKNGMPVFDVTKDCFYQNMNYGRRRLRFKSGSSASQYMQGTKYNRSFWIREPDGYTRKVK